MSSKAQRYAVRDKLISKSRTYSLELLTAKMHRQILEVSLMRLLSTRLRTMFPQERKWMERWKVFRRWYRTLSLLLPMRKDAEWARVSSKYQFMEANTQRRKAGLDEKIPDIQKTLDTVRFLKTRNVRSLTRRCLWCSFFSIFTVQSDSDPIEATFELNDTLYAKALVPPTEEVYLWLGANVMLAYPIAEAESLLEGKLSGAQQTLENCDEDLDFLREQITVSCLTLSHESCKLIAIPRHWRLRRQECIIGMSQWRGKRRRSLAKK